MAQSKEEKTDNTVKQNLTPDEEKELNEGMALSEMDKSNLGWQIVKGWYKDLAYHSWSDPRETTSEKEWAWRELNAFHASNAAKEILEKIASAISRADYLDKVKRGEIERKRMKI